MKKITIKFKDGIYKVTQGQVTHWCHFHTQALNVAEQLLVQYDSERTAPDLVESSLYGFTQNETCRSFIANLPSEWNKGVQPPEEPCDEITPVRANRLGWPFETGHTDASRAQMLADAIKKAQTYFRVDSNIADMFETAMKEAGYE